MVDTVIDDMVTNNCYICKNRNKETEHRTERKGSAFKRPYIFKLVEYRTFYLPCTTCLDIGLTFSLMVLLLVGFPDEFPCIYPTLSLFLLHYTNTIADQKHSSCCTHDIY